MTKQLTLKQAKEICGNLGMTLRKTDGEYRVTYRVTASDWKTREQAEEYAYYTNDLSDAVATARLMSVDHTEFKQA